jgi:hypothetical protein
VKIEVDWKKHRRAFERKIKKEYGADLVGLGGYSLARDPDNSDSYADMGISAMWKGYRWGVESANDRL